MHTALQFGHHSKNQLFSKLTRCPLREIALWPLLVRWTMSWRVYKPWADNSLTDRVMVYSHIFIQHQHTEDIFTLTLSFPINVHPALFQDECPEYLQPIFMTLHTCILQTAHFIMRMVLIARSASIYSGNSLLQDLICSQRASEQSQMRVLHFREIYQMQWAVFTESHNGLCWKGPKSHLIPTLLSWTGTPLTRPGFSKPHPALPGMGHLWELRAPSLFRLRMSWSKVFLAKETMKIIAQKCEKMAEVPVLPHSFCFLLIKFQRLNPLPAFHVVPSTLLPRQVPQFHCHLWEPAQPLVPHISRVFVLGADPDGGALFWDHHSVVSRFPCSMTVFSCSGGSHLSPCVLSVLLPACWRVRGRSSLPEQLQDAPAAGSAWLETDS